MTSQVTWLAPGVRGAAIAGVISCGVILVFVVDTNSDGKRKLKPDITAEQNDLFQDVNKMV